MLPTLTPQGFVAKWRPATLKESAGAQQHFIDLCRLVGHPTPAEMDPAGTSTCLLPGGAPGDPLHSPAVRIRRGA